ncbi:MAG: L,D-transpeptidase [Sporomusaceae bacterium]|nr:L,D-transpeptidase [Sporomusaceae bacterium]
MSIKPILKSVIALLFLSLALPAQAEDSIVINVPTRTLTFYQDGSLFKEYPIAIGSVSTPTPLGSYSIISKEINPNWYPPDQPGEVVLSGPYNPLGYRWLGFISNIYGIHGTNSPSSIGRAVTNGCIRMYEPDVEELFELVSYNTPVKITYNVTKVTVDKSGLAKISVFPDVYYRGAKADPEYVKNVLAENDLLVFVDETSLANALSKNSEKAVEIIRPVKLKINGQKVADLSIATRENIYLPLKAFGNRWENLISEKQGQKIILLENTEIPILFSKNTAYISGQELTKILSGKQTWQENKTVWSFEQTAVLLDKEKTPLDTIKTNGLIAVPLAELAKTLKRTGYWDTISQTYFLESNAEKGVFIAITPAVIGTEFFLPITKINQYFQIFVYWDTKNNIVELSSPGIVG